MFSSWGPAISRAMLLCAAANLGKTQLEWCVRPHQPPLLQKGPHGMIFAYLQSGCAVRPPSLHGTGNGHTTQVVDGVL